MAEKDELSPGDIIAGKFEVIEKRGTGSLGDLVYKGRHCDLERDIIIKILPSSITKNQELTQRFLQGIKLSASLQHPNILPALEAGEENGRNYLITSFEKGYYLGEYLEQRERLEESEAVKLIIALVDALKYAWDFQKILHRNISPDTILIARGNKPLLADFGMAKSLLDQGQNLTMSGYTVGNPSYMSPEQVRGESTLDFKSDIYCLGLVFYKMLAGHAAFEADSSVEMMNMQLNEDPEPVSEAAPGVSAGCVALVGKMLKKDCDSRHKDWDSLLNDLKAVQKGKRPPSIQKASDANKKKKPISQKLKSKTQTAPMPPSKSNPMPIIVGIIIVAIGIVALLFFLKSQNPVEEPDIVIPSSNVETVFVPKNNNDSAESTTTNNNSSTVPESRPDREWNETVAFVNDVIENRGNYEQAVIKLEIIREAATDDDRKAMAQAEIDKVKEAKQKAIIEIVSELEDKARELKEQSKYTEAGELLKSYDGRFASESQERRLALAEECFSQAKELANLKKAEEESKPKAKSVLLPVANEILRGKLDSAMKKFEALPSEQREKSVAKIIRDLQRVDDYIVRSFKPQVGQEVTIKMKKGFQVLKIKKVSKTSVYMEDQIGTKSIMTKLNLNNLSLEEKFKRLSRMSKSAKSTYLGILAVKRKKYSSAKKQFENAGPLAEALLEQLDAIKSK